MENQKIPVWSTSAVIPTLFTTKVETLIALTNVQILAVLAKTRRREPTQQKIAMSESFYTAGVKS